MLILLFYKYIILGMTKLIILKYKIFVSTLRIIFLIKLQESQIFKNKPLKLSNI